MDGLSRTSPVHWGGIRLFAMDVDGILTDGRVGIGSAEGEEIKFFSVLDGMGLARLRRAGIDLAWISGRSSGATARRAQELQIRRLVQGRVDKREALQEIAAAANVDQRHCVYMGDDDIDVPALEWAGIGATVPTAMPAALAAADYVTARAAGFGAVREVCERILAALPAAPA